MKDEEEKKKPYVNYYVKWLEYDQARFAKRQKPINDKTDGDELFINHFNSYKHNMSFHIFPSAKNSLDISKNKNITTLNEKYGINLPLIDKNKSLIKNLELYSKAIIEDLIKNKIIDRGIFFYK